MRRLQHPWALRRWHNALRLCVLALLSLAGAAAQAQTCSTCSSVTTGNWNATATWGGFTPTTTATVTINNGHTVTVTAATTVTRVTISTGGALTLNANATVGTLSVNAGATLTGNATTPPTLTLGGGSGNDVINNGSILFQQQSGGVTQPLGYITLSGASNWSGTGNWDLFSINVTSRALTFLAGSTVSLKLGGPTPYTRTTTGGSVTSLAGTTWEFNRLGDQTIPTAGTGGTNFNHGGITTSGSGIKTVAAGTVTALGNVTIGAGTTWNGATSNPAVNFRRNLTHDGTFNAGTGIHTFNGSVAQVLSGAAADTTFGRLRLNNATGLTVQHNVTVSTLLTLTSGVLTTSGAGVEVITSASCLSSVSRTSGRVAGTLRKTIPVGSPTCAFEIGDATTYRPVTGAAFTSVTTPFTVSASSSQAAGDHPDLASSPLNPTKGVTRYWTLTNNGPGSPFTSYNAVFTFVAGDVDAGAATGSFIGGRYSGGSWTLPTVGTRSATSTQFTGLTGFGDFAIAQPGIDHYELSQPSTGLACLPSTVTVTACADNSSPCTNAATFVAGQTATLATSGATLGATSLSFNGSGVATTTLSYPTASNGAVAAVTLSGESVTAANARKCCPDGSSCAAASACSTTFSTAGFVIAAAAGGAATTVPTQTAGTVSGNFVLRAVKSGTSTAACEAAITGATTVDWAYECEDPGTCSGSNLMRVNGGTPTTIARNNNGSVASYTAVPMSFDVNGNAPFNFTFSDVGQVTLWAGKTVNAAPLSGSSNTFVTRPAGFTVTGIQQTAAPNLANPAAASAAGAKFVKAGESFRATVTAVTSGGVATPNFGKESSPEGVLLTPTRVLPNPGSDGTLSNATVAGASFTAGVATVSNLAFSEVGIVTLTPAVADGNYLGAGGVSGTASGNVGRFVPAQFALSAPSVTHRSGLSCSPASTFSYLGENFRIGLTLTAQNTAGATTQNYSGAFAKLDPTAAAGWALAGRDGSTAFSAASGRISLGSATGSWSNGVASGVTLTANVPRISTPDGPFSAAFGIAPVDSDGVAMAAFDLASISGGSNDRATVGTVALRFGRLRLLNAMGPADRVLTLPVTSQHWNGTSFDTNTLDSCTAVAASAVNFGNLRRTLTTADTAVAAPITLSAGRGTLTLAAPGGGRSGTVDVALSLGSSATDVSCLQPWTPGSGDAATAGAGLAFLRGAWCGSSWDKDPAARATFGRPRGNDVSVYRREQY